MSIKLLAAAVATTVSATILAGILWLVPTSRSYPPDAPVSYATVQNIDYLSNFWLYIVAVLICVLVGLAFGHRVPAKIALRIRQKVRQRPKHSPSISRMKQSMILVAMLMVAVIGFTSQVFYSISGSLARMHEPFTAKLTDTFHEGELLAPIPSMRSSMSIPKPFLAHGPGMDLLPGLIALRFFPAGHHIVGTRIGAALLTLASFGCFLFAGYEVFAFVRPSRGLTDLFLRFCGLLMILVLFDFLCRGSPRRLIFFFQIGLIFRLLRFRSPSTAALALLLLTGASVPIGFMYNYAIGIGGILFVSAGTSLICLRQRASARIKYAAAASIGIAIGGLGSCAPLGSEWLFTVASNISYWSRFGQILTFTPMFRREWFGRPEWYIFALLLMVPVAIMAELVIFDFLTCRTLNRTLQRRTAEILLLVACLVESRSFLERADFQHFGFAAPVFVLASATQAIILAGPAAAVLFRSWKPWTRVYIPAILLALLAIAEYPHLMPGALVAKAHDLAASIHTPDSDLLRADYAEAIGSIKDQVSRQTCFYTLNSEGAWYDLLDAPSCSAFAQLNYARTIEGQARVVSDLRKFRPAIILVNSELRDGGYDEIPLQRHSRTVWDFVMANYQPLRTVAGFRFYELRQQPANESTQK